MYFWITYQPRKAYWKMLHESVFNKLLDKSQRSWLHWHGMLEGFRGDFEGKTQHVWHVPLLAMCYICFQQTGMFSLCKRWVCASFYAWGHLRAQVCVCSHWFGALVFVLRAGSFTSDFDQKSLLSTCEFVNLPLCVSQVLDLVCCLFPLVQ